MVDLLLWCLNRPTKFVYSLSCVPHLFYLLNRHLKQQVAAEDHRHIQNHLVEYLFSSPIVLRLKQKFLSFNGGLDLSTSMGKVPLALLKSIAFLETLTNYSGFTKHSKAVYMKKRFMESILFVIRETDLIGLVPLMASLLLQEGSYDTRSSQSQKSLP